MRLGLVGKRHEMKVDGFVFDDILDDPTNIKKMDTHCIRFFSDMKPKLKKREKIELFVTGCTPALICAINACKILEIPIVLWHYNLYTKNYFKQEVI